MNGSLALDGRTTASATVRELLEELVAAASPNPPGDERAVAATIERAAARLRLPSPVRHAGRPERPNLILEIGSGSPRLLLAAHMDTMPVGDPDAWETDPFTLCERGGRLVGLGAADMKAAIAAMLAAAARIVRRPTESGTLLLAFTADEENGSADGMEWLCRQGLIAADAAVMCEPASVGLRSWESLFVAQRGSCVVRLRASGKPGHSGAPVAMSERASAAFAASLSALIATDAFPELAHPVDGTRPLVNVATMVRGGEVPFAHPAALEAIIEVRTISGMTERDVLQRLRNVIDHADVDRDRISLEPASAGSWIPAGETVRDARLLDAARRAWKQAIGAVAREAVLPCGTDSSHVDALGIPALPAFGPGSLADAHRPNESLPVDDLPRAIDLFEALARDYLGTA